MRTEAPYFSRMELTRWGRRQSLPMQTATSPSLLSRTDCGRRKDWQRTHVPLVPPAETSHVMFPVGERNVRAESDADAGTARAKATPIGPSSFHAARFVPMSVRQIVTEAQPPQARPPPVRLRASTRCRTALRASARAGSVVAAAQCLRLRSRRRRGLGSRSRASRRHGG
jgi:hypothetical protein